MTDASPFVRKPKIQTSERRIQDQLYRYLWQKGHHEISPNVYLYEWESDMVSLTKAGYLHEYEIKISRSDFLADKKKVEKHSGVQHGWRLLTDYEKLQYDHQKQNEFFQKAGYFKHLTSEGHHRLDRPNYFWYVCPADMVKPEEVPDYAGLMYVGDKDWHAITVVRQAPKLHRVQATSAQIMTILVAMEWRYWRLRMKEPEEPVSEVVTEQDEQIKELLS